MNYLIIAGKIIASSGILYGYYKLFLQNRRFHRYNRFYLMAVLLFSVLLPFIELPVFENTLSDPAVFRSLRAVTWGSFQEQLVEANSGNSYAIINLTRIIYFSGVFVFFWFLLRAVTFIRSLRLKYPVEKWKDLSFYNTNEPGTPFSFFKSIFWNKAVDPSSEPGQKIFRHELFHIRQYHSLDVLLCEFVCIIAWFNPFFHLIRKEVKAIHEFLADEYAAGNNDPNGYAELLVLQSINLRHAQLVHPFFHNHLKRRINMITQFNKSRSGYWSRIMILPIAAILFCVISLYAQRSSSSQNAGKSLISNEQPFVLMIDAGHGGNDAGAKSADGKYAEKDIALAIAKNLRDEAEAAGIKVVMLRTSDVSLTVQERASMNASQKPDLFVSIHVGAGPEPVNNLIGGAEAFIGSKKPENKIASIELGNSILNALEPVIKVTSPVKENRYGRIWVLDESPCPGVLIHCGFMTNEKDVLFITNRDNQQKIANRILSGILHFNRQKESIAQHDPVYIQTIAHTDTIPADRSKITFTELEIVPAYPGGGTAWVEYLKKKLRYPDLAEKRKISGTVLVKFIIDENGKVVHIGPVTGPEELKSEGIRIIRESGTWLPGMQNGIKVKAYHEQPIVFRLENS